MTRIADMTLQYQGRGENPPAGKFGTYLGSGDGTISGPMVAGRVAWNLFEIQGAANCDANMIGTVTTEDGAEVRFETLGFFRRRPGASQWSLAAGVRFATNDQRYAPLDGRIGWITGEFDMESYSHQYGVFVAGADAAAVAWG